MTSYITIVSKEQKIIEDEMFAVAFQEAIEMGMHEDAALERAEQNGGY